MPFIMKVVLLSQADMATYSAKKANAAASTCALMWRMENEPAFHKGPWLFHPWLLLTAERDPRCMPVPLQWVLPFMPADVPGFGNPLAARPMLVTPLACLRAAFLAWPALLH